MAGADTLKELVDTIKFHKPLETIYGESMEIEVHIHREEDTIFSVTGITPYFTMEDLHRVIWLQSGKKQDTYPKYSYLSFESEDGLQSAMYTYKDGSEETNVIQLPEPVEVIREGVYLELFADEEGNILPIHPLPRGRVTLQMIFGNEYPVFHVYPFKYLYSLYTGVKPISVPDWNGLFNPYFPDLKPTDTGDFNQEDIKDAISTETYIRAKLDQAKVVESVLEASLSEEKLQELNTTGVRQLIFQWADKQDISMNEGVDSIFFSAEVNEMRPFLRLLMPNTTPMTKLYQPDPLKPPMIHDAVLLNTWVSEPVPISDESFLIAKIPLRGEEYGLPPIYGTLRLMDDMTADFTIQPPKDLRILDVRRDLHELSEKLYNSLGDIMPFINSVKLAKANLNIEIKFEGLPRRDIRTVVASRLEKLSTIFQRITPPKDDVKPFLSLRYKAVSNFTTEDKISSYLTYVFSRQSFQTENQKRYVEDLAEEFNISEREATDYLVKYFQKSIEISTADDDGKDFIVLNNPGIDISLFNQSASIFILQMFNIRAVDISDIERVTTIIQLAFFGTDDAWEDALESVKLESKKKVDAASARVERNDLEEEQGVQAQGGQTQGRTQGMGRIIGLENFEQEEYTEEEASNAVQPTPAKVKEVEKAKESKEAKVEETGKIISDNWFIRQLQKLDPVLFAYKLSNPSELHYTSKCQSSDDRQPVILTREQFQNMIRIYTRRDATNPKRDYVNRVAFIVYGEREPNPYSPSAAIGKEFQITVLRYGSDTSNLFYFLCWRLFCLRDLLPILEPDWEDTTDYNGERKPSHSCPFCHGTLIKNKKAPGEGETVYRRKNKAKYLIPHDFVNFLNNPSHPQGYELPCCFISRKDIGPKDERLKRIRDADSKLQVPGDEDEEEEEQRNALDEAHRGREQLIVPFDVIAWKLPKEYVVGPEKYPLEPGKIGLPSVSMDAYFGQDSTKFVDRTSYKQEFKPNVNGFFRLGVFNKPSFMNQSLFAALGPLLGKNTITDVAKFFAEVITPRVFMNLNFGNLLLEFFDPKDKTLPGGGKRMLKLWAKHVYLSSELTDFELSRLYRSYHRFLQYLDDPAQKKQLRHFVHALAEPGLLTREGLTIITLHYKGDPRNAATNVEVLCPMLGFDTERYSNNAIAFLSYSDAGIWEPLVYIGNLSTGVTANKSAFYKLSQEDLLDPSFPRAVQQRYEEFTTQCRSSYRGAFTLQQGVANTLLLPVSLVLSQLGMERGIKISGIVRDSYNHLIGLTVETPIAGRTGDILIPVVDDGYSFHDRLNLKIYMTLDDIPKAGAKDVEEVYKIVRRRLSQYTNIYEVKEFIAVADKPKNKVVGFVLGNPEKTEIKIPCGELREGDTLEKEIIIQDAGDYMFEYKLNREIQWKSKEEIEQVRIENDFTVAKKQIDELYEHLRLSFANWVATADGDGMRTYIKSIIEDAVTPAWEKMRRLDIEYGPTIQNWFARDAEVEPLDVLLRRDCIAITERDMEKCTGVCKVENGMCKIHTPEQIQIRSTPNPPGPQFVEASRYFSLRLFDEIVRIPSKRFELLNKGVKKIQIPKTNVHIGTAWILPENVPAWYDLLREGYSAKGKEMPRYYEEFSGEREEMVQGEVERVDEEVEDMTNGMGEQEVVADMSAVYRAKDIIPLSDVRIPDSIKSLFSKEALKQLGIKILQRGGDKNTLVIMNYFEAYIDVNADSFSPSELGEFSKEFGKPMVQVLTAIGAPSILGRSYSETKDKVFPAAAVVIFPDLLDGPGILISLSDDAKVIPTELLEGPLKQSIQLEVPVKKKRNNVTKRKPTTAMKANVAATTAKATATKTTTVKNKARLNALKQLILERQRAQAQLQAQATREE